MTGRLLAVGLLTLLALVGAWLLAAGTPLVILLAAGIPAAAYAVAIIRIDRYRREPLAALVAAFVGGALLAAGAAGALNDAVLALMALGFKQVEAHETARKVQASLSPQSTVEDLVRACLRKT